MRRLLACVAVVALGACGIEDDTRPRVIAQEDQVAELAAAAPELVVAQGTSARIYLLVAQVPGQTPRLRAVTRDVVATPASLFGALTAPLNAAEQDDRLRSAVPSTAELVATPAVVGGVVTLDLDEGIFDASGTTLVDALAQIVFTMSELSGIDAVDLRVNGVRQEWPTGGGSLTDEPLRTVDYPERNPTSQPDYPGAAPAQAGT